MKKFQGSNSSTLSWNSLQTLRKIANTNSSRPGSITGKVSPFQTHLYEHSMMYGDTNPSEYRQTLVESYLHQFDQKGEESNFLAVNSFNGAPPAPAPPAPPAGGPPSLPLPQQPKRRGSSSSGNNVLRGGWHVSDYMI